MKYLFLVMFLIISEYCLSQSKFEQEIKNYHEKLSEIDTTTFLRKELEITNYVFGEIHSIAIVVSRKIEDHEISFFFDSLKYFHRNGILKRITVYDSMGVPTSTKTYRKTGKLKKECKYVYQQEIPFLLNKIADRQLECYIKEYKNEVISEEGLYINKKKEGVHLYYNKTGDVSGRVKYNKGKVVNSRNIYN